MVDVGMSRSERVNIAETVCRRHPDAVYRVALEEVQSAGSNTYTFGGLDYLSDKFASTLKENGIQPGDLVAVLLPPSAAFLVAHLGVLKLGATVVPLLLHSGPLFIKTMIAEVIPKAWVIDESHLRQFEDAFKGLSEVIVFVATDDVSKKQFTGGHKGFWYEINFADADFEIAKAADDTPAYFFITPGQSQDVKPVAVTHGALCAASQGQDQGNVNQVDEGQTRVNQDWASMSVLLKDLFPALYNGRVVTTK
jgi:acetyl-CoA synthetase